MRYKTSNLLFYTAKLNKKRLFILFLETLWQVLGELDRQFVRQISKRCSKVLPKAT